MLHIAYVILDRLRVFLESSSPSLETAEDIVVYSHVNAPGNEIIHFPGVFLEFIDLSLDR